MPIIKSVEDFIALKNRDTSAYPVKMELGNVTCTSHGLNKREFVAAQVLSAVTPQIISEMKGRHPSCCSETIKSYVKLAVLLTDNLFEELEIDGGKNDTPLQD